MAKFGGTSLADARRILQVADIVEANPARRLIVVSAPGARTPGEKKITDQFIDWHEKGSASEAHEIIRTRYREITFALGISPIDKELDKIKDNLFQGYPMEYAASRGEYLCAGIVAKILDYDFVDAADYIHFNESGKVQDVTRLRTLIGKQVVIPGFYGSKPDGSIEIFPRSGSDITGALVARETGAMVYENWSDTQLRMADPRIVPSPRRVRSLTYRELRELTYGVQGVFHSEAIFPVQEADIPTHILNTFDPEDEGTWILPDDKENERILYKGIAGIAGRKGFAVFTIEKPGMNDERGFLRKVLSIFENRDISIEHTPGMVDSISIIVNGKGIEEQRKKIEEELQEVCQPKRVIFQSSMALIAVVGRGMIHEIGIAKKVFGALAAQNINVRMINQGASELSILIGVEDGDCANAICALHEAFANPS